MNIKSLLLGSAAALAAVSFASAAELIAPAPLDLAASPHNACTLQAPELVASVDSFFTQTKIGPQVASIDTTLGPQLAEAGGRHTIVLASLSPDILGPTHEGVAGSKVAFGGGGGGW